MAHHPVPEPHGHAGHAEHAAHARDPYISRVSITVAVLAVLAAGAGSLETVENSRALSELSQAILAQDKATDAWNEYEAAGLKAHMNDIAAENGAGHLRQDSQEEHDAQASAGARASDAEKERDSHIAASGRHEERHHRLTAAAILAEIAIALSSVAIITRRRPFWFAVMGLGGLGAVLCGAAYL